METQITTPKGPITLRPGREADAPAYRALRLEALRNYPTAFGADYATNEAHPPSYWVERLRALGSQNMFYFATHNEALIGMCGIYRDNSPKTRHSATIISVYVQPEWRGLQIAEGLIERCCEWVRDQGVTIVKLAVVSTNLAAIRCYTRCGFRTYGTDPQAICYEGVMYDELLMARVL